MEVVKLCDDSSEREKLLEEATKLRNGVSDLSIGDRCLHTSDEFFDDP